MEFASLLGIALWALLPGFIAKKKGRSFWGYYFLSFLISPLITMIITLCVKNLNDEYHYEQPTNTNQGPTCQATNPVNPYPANTPGWQCSCGRTHPQYETSCVCGKSKFDNITTPKLEEPTTELSQTADRVLFCRKCGEKLIDNSQFCRKCGTEIIKE